MDSYIVSTHKQTHTDRYLLIKIINWSSPYRNYQFSMAMIVCATRLALPIFPFLYVMETVISTHCSSRSYLGKITPITKSKMKNPQYVGLMRGYQREIYNRTVMCPLLRGSNAAIFHISLKNTLKCVCDIDSFCRRSQSIRSFVVGKPINEMGHYKWSLQIWNSNEASRMSLLKKGNY